MDVLLHFGLFRQAESQRVPMHWLTPSKLPSSCRKVKPKLGTKYSTQDAQWTAFGTAFISRKLEVRMEDQVQCGI